MRIAKFLSPGSGVLLYGAEGGRFTTHPDTFPALHFLPLLYMYMYIRSDTPPSTQRYMNNTKLTSTSTTVAKAGVRAGAGAEGKEAILTI